MSPNQSRPSRVAQTSATVCEGQVMMDQQDAGLIIERYTHGESFDPITIHEAARSFDLEQEDLDRAARLVRSSRLANGHSPRVKTRKRPRLGGRAIDRQSLRRVPPEFWVIARYLYSR